jgi:hypothetical protein
MATIGTAIKDPQATLDYPINWAPWLTTDTISSVVWTVPTGITQTATSNTTTTATIWLSGGEVGTEYTVTCRVTTTAGRIDERSIAIRVAQR